MRWLIGDAMAMLWRRKKIASSLWELGRSVAHNPFAKNSGKKQKVLNCFDVLDWEDPMPFLYELQHKTWRRAFGAD
jgi:hypothetical protein